MSTTASTSATQPSKSKSFVGLDHASIDPGTKRLVTMAIMLATIIQVLDTTIANVALPHMMGSLSATQDQVSWVLTSYIVASAIMTLPTGYLAGRYGRKAVLLVCIGGFTLASMLCGAAQSLEEMVLFRVVQGVFGAALVPLSQSTLLDINERKDHGKAMAVWGMGVMIGPILGPSLGGYLTEFYSWRYVFYINLPLGILSLLGLLFWLPESNKSDRPFDVMGFFTLSIGIACLQLIMDRGESQDWFSSLEIQTYVAVLIGSLWMYLVHTWRAEHPFLSPGMLRDRNLQMGLFFIFVVGIVLLTTMALLPPYMQNLMGYSVLDVGMILAPRGVGTLVAMMIVGRIASHVDQRYLILFGLLLTAYALNMMCGFTTFVPEREIIVTGMIQGFGLGFVFIPLSSVTYTTLPPHYRAEAASLFSLVRNIGSSIGVSLGFTLFARIAARQHAYLGESITQFSTWLPLNVNPDFAAPGSSAALALLNGEITRQAMTIAYINDFRLMMWLVLSLVPMLLFLSSTKPKADKVKAPAGGGGSSDVHVLE
ncbi:MAG: DHA2 family efflux MFS transporter permease subunit [Pseudomonadales bacterium]|jgi:DHA2 family multidrug resistance protein|nr:DHA2 family efflux MFS transporter permease subunit [Pseudomonadales bacterium]